MKTRPSTTPTILSVQVLESNPKGMPGNTVGPVRLSAYSPLSGTSRSEILTQWRTDEEKAHSLQTAYSPSFKLALNCHLLL